MRGIPFNLSGKGALDAVAAQILVEEDKGGTFCSGSSHRKKKDEILEPRSVLHHSRSPSPPTSTSTLSSSLSGACGGSNDTGGAAAVSEIHSQKEECGVGVDDWEMMLTAIAASPNQEQTCLRWIMGDLKDLSPASKLHPSQVSFLCFEGTNGTGFRPAAELWVFGRRAFGIATNHWRLSGQHSS